MCGYGLTEQQLNLLLQCPLIALECQNIVSAFGHDGLDDLTPGSHRINSDDTAFELHQFKQRGSGGDLITLAIDLLLTQHQPVLAGPGTDHVDGAFAISLLKGAPHGFPVDSDHIPLAELAGGIDPGDETLLQRFRLQATEHSCDGVMLGDAVWYRESSVEARSSAPGQSPRSPPSLRHHRARRWLTKRDIHQLVALAAVDPWVGYCAEVAHKVG